MEIDSFRKMKDLKKLKDSIKISKTDFDPKHFDEYVSVLKVPLNIFALTNM